MSCFRVRLNCVDHYQAAPTDFDPPQTAEGGKEEGTTKGKEREKAKQHVNLVPVIRVFGSTPSGQKVCVHVHGAFPYLYVEYKGDLESAKAIEAARRLRAAIDHALAVSYRRDLKAANNTFVAHISIVKGTPFYGYHVGYQFFFKIYLLNPLYINRLSDLLLQGAVLATAMQPFESHIQYVPQWMCDYNLFGCDYMDASRVMFRHPVPDPADLGGVAHRWHSRSIPEKMISDQSKLQRQSHCPIEVDIRVQDIVNRESVKARKIHHGFIERLQPLSDDEKLVTSMAGLWRDETRRRKARMGLSDSEGSPFPPEALVSVSADSRDTQPGGWIHEGEYREMMLRLIEAERSSINGRPVNFRDFVRPHPFENLVKTVLESVEDLHTLPHPDPGGDLREERATIPHSPGGSTEADTESVESYADSFTRECDEDSFYGKCLSQFERDNAAKDNSIDAAGENPGSGDLRLAERDDVSRESTKSPGSTESPESPDSPGLLGPGLTADLESVGIRNAGVHDRSSEDVFEIPARYTRSFGSTPDGHKSSKRSMDENGGSRKRRKLLRDESPQLEDQHRWQLDRSSDDSLNDTTFPGDRTPPASQIPTEELQDSFESSGNLSETIHAGAMASHDLQTGQTHEQEGQDRFDSLDACSVGSDGRSSINASIGAEAHTQDVPIHSDVSSTQAAAVSQMQESFDLSRGLQLLYIADGPPSAASLAEDMRDFNMASAVYQDPYYSHEPDVPKRPREYGGKTFRIKGVGISYLPAFNPTADLYDLTETDAAFPFGRIDLPGSFLDPRKPCTLRTWEIEQPPPTREEVESWLAESEQSNGLTKDSLQNHTNELSSQIDGPTQKNKNNFLSSQPQPVPVRKDVQYMSIMSLEVHVNTRKDFVPDPEKDEIACLFWCLQPEDERLDTKDIRDATRSGVIVLSEPGETARQISPHANLEIDEESNELDVINRLIDVVRQQDPDILTGFEVHGGSWGYVIERARCKFSFDICDEFSRVVTQSHGRFGKESDRWGFNQTSTIRVTGRHTINIWRAMRGELNLLQYTMENVAHHVLHRRIPHYSFADLTAWYRSGKPRHVAKVFRHYLSRAQVDLEILERNELVPRTCEQARLLGVDFFSVFSRGSQFKVESLMFRIAKAESLILVSPSRKQVGGQNALECLPLVMEPQSAFYNSPLLVLDFQSLYPSIMIAYNYCYSTYLGRCAPWRGQNKMGFIDDFSRQPGLLELLQDDINIAPNGIMYAKQRIRKSLLAKMLGEILETRVMVKSGMKEDKDDRLIQRLLNNRQLALKLIANVTYGYTSASFSGRMPCSEIADSIVQTARETLEKAIALIHSVGRWRAEVVYGDTDSLFIYLDGRTRDEAFAIGNEIAQAVTEANPKPVKLKFEKVYHPCVLLAKKRYVGFKYESKDQKEPEFDAKGIETVRRDGTPAEQKIEETALKILFRTADLSEVKRYFQDQCMKIMKGKYSIQDFCFAKEVRLGTYSDKGHPPPPGALISTRKMMRDPRAEPQYGERVPYVVITGAPGARLIDRCVPPEHLLYNDQFGLDSDYYISKNLIPPLERIFNLVGASVRQWYAEMPKYKRVRRPGGALPDAPKSKRTIEFYMVATECSLCRGKLDPKTKGKGKGTKSHPICSPCMRHRARTLLKVRAELNEAESKAADLARVCRSCSGLAFGEKILCESKDCPVFYSRVKYDAALTYTRAARLPIIELLEAGKSGALDW